MRAESNKLAATLRLNGTPDQFQSAPKARKLDWELLQEMDMRSLKYTAMLQGSGNTWSETVAKLTQDCQNMRDLIEQLKVVNRRVDRNSHARLLLMPTKKFFRHIDSVKPGASDADVRAMLREWTHHYVTFFLEDNHSGPLERTLQVYEFFQVLECLPVKWSPVHYFKCNCPDCFYWAGCHHVLLASMVIDRDIRIPMQYVTQTVQLRRKRGRPGKGGEVDEAPELACRSRPKLVSRRIEYVVPQVFQFIMSCELSCLTLM
jgi:hypothetical protein